MEDIADTLGVSRRTLFRYFPSKNDIVWGDFDWVLSRLRRHLEEAATDLPLMEAITHAAVESNRYDVEELPELRMRMELITTAPALQAHSMARYAAWRGIISEFSAQRLGVTPDDMLPLTIGYTALGASMAAFSRWLAHPEEDLTVAIRKAYDSFLHGFTLERLSYVDL
jgi:mycofactocin system transcriptional regulator